MIGVEAAAERRGPDKQWTGCAVPHPSEVRT